MCKIHNGIPPSQLPHCILVQTSTSNIFQRQHCEKLQTKPSPISMGGHGRRVSFQYHPNCSTRIINVNAQKAKRIKIFGFNAKKSWYIAPCFQHYRTFKSIMASTTAERISDTVRFKHHAIAIPKLTPANRILEAS